MNFAFMPGAFCAVWAKTPATFPCAILPGRFGGAKAIRRNGVKALRRNGAMASP
jgi:hypothetical protein